MIFQPIPMNPPADVALAGIWREHHRYLLNVAYRMLGSVSEAEDAVQDAFARLLRLDLAAIDDVRGWLVVAVTRRCLDQLRSARARREVYVGPWLPEPVIDAPDQGVDPAERVTLDDSVRMAMLLVLERLSPAERTAFVLHDVFQFSFEDVAAIVGRTPAACRQLASRARRHVKAETTPARFQVDPADLARVADRFVAAAANGDLAELMQALDPNVVSRTDSGGVVPAPRRPLVGRREVARHFLQFVRAFRIRLVPMPVNGEPGALAWQDDRLVAVIALSIRDGLVDQINGIGNPAKLAYVASLLAAAAVGATASGESSQPEGVRPRVEPNARRPIRTAVELSD
jgi:RNA polymerase sigma-70 factor, ECF subfamily